MGLLSWIIIGGLAGWIASMIMRTNASMGVLANIVVGIVGAFVGGFIMSLINQTGVTGFNLYSFLVALLGSIVILAIFKSFRKNMRR